MPILVLMDSILWRGESDRKRRKSTIKQGKTGDSQ